MWSSERREAAIGSLSGITASRRESSIHRLLVEPVCFIATGTAVKMREHTSFPEPAIPSHPLSHPHQITRKYPMTVSKHMLIINYLHQPRSSLSYIATPVFSFILQDQKRTVLRLGACLPTRLSNAAVECGITFVPPGEVKERCIYDRRVDRKSAASAICSLSHMTVIVEVYPGDDMPTK